MYTVKDIAAKLRVDQETVRRWIRFGELEAMRYGVGRKHGSVITQEQLMRFLSNHPKYIPYDDEAASLQRKKESLLKEIEDLNGRIAKLMDKRRILINELKSLG